MTALPRIEDGGGPGVELLERAIGYTRGALATVTDADLSLPTPCADWDLADLLAHMEDALDAFTEGADGHVALAPTRETPLDRRLAALRDKACGLLGAWAGAPAVDVAVGGRRLPVPLVSRVAAIEILLHGWDVRQSTGAAARIPDDLAEALLPTALLVADGSPEFGPPLRTSYDAAPGTRLLALTGRELAG